RFCRCRRYALKNWPRPAPRPMRCPSFCWDWSRLRRWRRSSFGGSGLQWSRWTMRHRVQQPAPIGQRISWWPWLGPLLYMAVVSLYFAGRYAGRWAENDSAVFADIIRVFAHAGRLVPERGAVYPNGYAYQAISTFIVTMTGLDVATLQQLVYPLVAPLVV